MFLERGFDNVKITEVAEACGVSEKTVYNYFLTKESLVLDQEEEMSEDIARELGPAGQYSSPVNAMVAIIKRRLDRLEPYFEDAGPSATLIIRDFTEMINSTPSLKKAQSDMTERVADLAARTLAERAGVDPDDPEPQIAADALLGLWRIYFSAGLKYADEGISLAKFKELILSDVERAARLIDTGLWSFSLAVQGTTSRDELRHAAEASMEARKQVVAAIKQAKIAWHHIKSETKAGAKGRVGNSKNGDATKEEIRRAQEPLRRDAQNLRDVVHQTKRDAHAAHQQIKEEFRKQVKDASSRKKK